ncbi:MAG: helix-turn-helix domain-containing protein [Stappiaceae bacterium]
MKSYLQRGAVFFAALLFLSVSALQSRAEGESNTCVSGQIAGIDNTLLEKSENQLRALNVEYFLDDTGMLESDAIFLREFTHKSCGSVIQAPLPGQALWLRFTAQNEHDKAKAWIVTFAEIIFDEVVLYEQRQDEGIIIAQDGRTIPSSQRASRTIKPALPLAMGSGETRTFYLRIAGTVEPTITPVITTPGLLTDWSTSAMVINALFLSYVLSIIIFSLIIFRQIEVRFYKYYTLYLASQFIFSFLYDGWAHHLLGVELPVTILSPVMFFFTGVGVFANVQYCRILLEVDARQRRLKVLFALLTVAALITTSLAVLDPWTLALPLHLSYILSPFILLIVSLIKIREGLPQARPIALSLLFYVCGLVIAVYYFIFPPEIVRAAHAYELILLNPIGWGYYLAIVGETTFMLIAISVMVKALQQQKQAAILEADTLRSDVTEHAEALENTNARIGALETILTEDSDKNLLPPSEKRFVDRATDCVLAHVSDENFGVKELATALATSERTLGRRMKKSLGLTSAAFVRSVRLGFARDLILMRQHNTIAEVAHAAGFSSTSHFSKMYRQEFNETPGEALKVATSNASNPVTP